MSILKNVAKWALEMEEETSEINEISQVKDNCLKVEVTIQKPSFLQNVLSYSTFNLVMLMILYLIKHMN